MLVWESLTEDGDGLGVYGRLFDAAGVALGDPERLNGEVVGDQSRPVVGAAGDDSFVVAWREDSAVVTRVFGSDFSVQTAERVTNVEPAVGDPAIAVPSTGAAILGWPVERRSGPSLHLRLVDPDAVADGAPFSPDLGGALRAGFSLATLGATRSVAAMALGPVGDSDVYLVRTR